MYKGYVSQLIVAHYLVMHCIRHVCFLLPLLRPHLRDLLVPLPFIMPYVRHACLDLYIAVSLKGRTTLAFGALAVVLLILLQWDMLGLDYHLM